AVGLQRRGDEPEDRRQHDRQHQPRQDIKAPVNQDTTVSSSGARKLRPPDDGTRRADVTSRSRLKMRYQTKTQTPMISISSVDAAAPKPNRLFENDCRTISVIIRSASGPGLLPSRITGIANW